MGAEAVIVPSNMVGQRVTSFTRRSATRRSRSTRSTRSRCAEWNSAFVLVRRDSRSSLFYEIQDLPIQISRLPRRRKTEGRSVRESAKPGRGADERPRYPKDGGRDRGRAHPGDKAACVKSR